MLPTSFDGYFLEPEFVGAGSFVTRWQDPTWGLGWALLDSPVEIRTANAPEEIERLLQAIEADSGSIWALSLPYEAGSWLSPQIAAKPGSFHAWAASYEPPAKFYKELAPVYAKVGVAFGEADFDEPHFQRAFASIRTALACGDSYQINLTHRMPFQHTGSAWDLFVSRCGVEPSPYATFIHGGDWQIASWSPELFLERHGDLLRMRPMKGTGRPNAGRLDDAKGQAENLMIVDMVRNDLGAVAESGSVRVEALFTHEQHRTVSQMTSTVTARSKRGLTDVLKATFPPASVTGAPKVAACAIIERLELSSRGVYCGALGIIEPRGDFRLSVTIRTALLRDGKGLYGVGSGIVWDSTPDAEFAEWNLKADLLRQPAPQWALVEAFPSDYLGHPEKLSPHLERMAASATELGIPFSVDQAWKLLGELRDSGLKARLLAQRDGDLALEISPRTKRPDPMVAAIANTPVSSKDPSLRHKTTARGLYHAHLSENAGYDEVLLFNELGQATEFCNGALAVRRNGQWLTPDPVQGCLPSTGAAGLGAEKAVILIEELANEREIAFVNALSTHRIVLRVSKTSDAEPAQAPIEIP